MLFLSAWLAVKSSRIIPHNHFSVAVTIKIADTESKVATAPLVDVNVRDVVLDESMNQCREPKQLCVLSDAFAVPTCCNRHAQRHLLVSAATTGRSNLHHTYA